ncbi:MAG: type II toxin-antitoxin system HicA family toxin [Dehalococcoidia bacterium]|nr:type II toxin-antitoxin system HicA family toxin [Dehalococcoidia bacterium]
MPRIIPIDYRKLVQIFEKEVFTVSRTRGDHISMTKPGVKRPVVIKNSPRNVIVAHIRTNLTTAGITRERYFELLGEVE